MSLSGYIRTGSVAGMSSLPRGVALGSSAFPSDPCPGIRRTSMPCLRRYSLHVPEEALDLFAAEVSDGKPLEGGPGRSRNRAPGPARRWPPWPHRYRSSGHLRSRASRSEHLGRWPGALKPKERRAERPAAGLEDPTLLRGPARLLAFFVRRFCLRVFAGAFCLTFRPALSLVARATLQPLWLNAVSLCCGARPPPPPVPLRHLPSSALGIPAVTTHAVARDLNSPGDT